MDSGCDSSKTICAIILKQPFLSILDCDVPRRYEQFSTFLCLLIRVCVNVFINCLVTYVNE